jgi:hypothetical protein
MLCKYENKKIKSMNVKIPGTYFEENSHKHYKITLYNSETPN